MALNFQPGEVGFTPDELETKDGGFSITRVDWLLTAKVPGIEREALLKLAENAEQNCPVSQTLSAVEISLKVELT